MRPHAQASIEDACSIAATELRGITLTQLRDLWTKIAGLADEDGYLQDWKDYGGKICHKDTVNLYDVIVEFTQFPWRCLTLLLMSRNSTFHFRKAKLDKQGFAGFRHTFQELSRV